MTVLQTVQLLTWSSHYLAATPTFRIVEWGGLPIWNSKRARVWCDVYCIAS